MGLEYKEKIFLRNSDFSFQDKIKPQSILQIAEEVAGRHAAILGNGYEALKQKGLAWVCVRTKFEMLADLENGKDAIIETYTVKPGKIDMDRSYIFYDLDGNTCIKGTTKWVLIDFNTRRIQRTSVIDYPYDSFRENAITNMSKCVIGDDIVLNNRVDFKMLINDLDHNMHVNNTRYVEHVFNTFSLNETRQIKSFEVEYVKELKYGCNAYLIYDDSLSHYKMYNENNELSFIMNIEWR